MSSTWQQDKGPKRPPQGDDDAEEPDHNSERGSRASKRSRQSQQVPGRGRTFVRRCYMCGKTADDTQPLEMIVEFSGSCRVWNSSL